MKNPYLLFVSFALLFFISCGKYEDGPDFSLRSKKSRLLGEWTLEYAVQGGIDITSSVTLGGTIDLKFEKDGTYKFSNDYTVLGQNMNNSVSGTWSLIDHKTTLLVTNLLLLSEQSKILRLTNKELWLEQYDVNGIIYEAHYISK